MLTTIPQKVFGGEKTQNIFSNNNVSEKLKSRHKRRLSDFSINQLKNIQSLIISWQIFTLWWSHSVFDNRKFLLYADTNQTKPIKW